MTDSIDLDDIDVQDDDDRPERNRGDWFWRGEGDPDDEPADPAGADPSATDAGADPTSAGEDPERERESERDGASGGPVPRVPRENEGKPVGIPMEGGGAGGADAKRAGERERERTLEADANEPSASGPHGGGVDDMTTAFTYEALKRLKHLQTALADANTWSDWIGIVGDVPAHVITTFQRNNGVDADFFNGAGAGPAERLADIDRSSMFFAERMVVIGLPGEEWFAEEADWEFVPLSEAAEGAGWELRDDGADGTV
ncbi:DUF7124 domain-containing protein [Halomarina litorea]|uniref:DUF7124 domain-containing protein n=1 Tax=Halomarina litorea TaxID=2961595 RepID=UPI0020C2073F|nr:hypothetical protein [Halomarina sp. BCD28]